MENEELCGKYLTLEGEITENKRQQSFYGDFSANTEVIISSCSVGRKMATELFELLKIATESLDFFIYSDIKKDKILKDFFQGLDGANLKI